MRLNYILLLVKREITTFLMNLSAKAFASKYTKVKIFWDI